MEINISTNQTSNAADTLFNMLMEDKLKHDN